MKKSHNGFSLTEMLAAVVIVGILMLIVVPAVSNFVGKGKVRYYHSLEDSLKAALQDYLLDYRSLLPREIGEITKITSEELVDNNYIDEIVDENKDICSADLTVEKTDKQKYKYYVCLKCGGKDEEGNVKGTIFASDTKSCELESNGDVQSKNFDIKLNSDISTTVNQCADSSEVKIPKATVKEIVNGKEETVITDSLLSNPRSIDTKVLGSTTLKYTYRYKSLSKTIEVVDWVNPEITSIKLSTLSGSQYNSNIVNGQLMMVVNSKDLACPDKYSNLEGSGISSVQYKLKDDTSWTMISTTKNTNKITFSETIFGVLQVKVTDKTGKSSEIEEIEINLDKNNPSETTVKYLGGSNSHSWKNNYKLQLEATDDVSVAYYEIDYNHDGITDEATGDIYIPKNNFNYCNVRFRAVDVAGNRGEWSDTQHIHMDTGNPSKTTVSLGTYTSGSWTNKDVIQTYTATDGESSVVSYEYSYDKENIIGSTIGSWTWSTDGEFTIYARAIDEVGNKGAWSDSYTIRRDIVKPSCKLTVTNNPTSVGGWYTSNVAIGFSESSDNASSVTTSIDKSLVTETTSSSGTTVTGIVTDQAGNTKTCTLSVKLDNTVPVITAKSNPIILDYQENYNFTSNVNSTFGPLGGTVTCNPASSKLEGTYNVICQATGNNGKTSALTFSVEHAKLLYNEILKNPLITTSPNLNTASSNSSESGLYKSTSTNSGNPTYYFRGNITNNYVKFAGYVWRVVRINEDGTIRVILENGINNDEGYRITSTWNNYLNMYYTNSDTAKSTLESWYKNNITNKGYGNWVVAGNYFCEQAKAAYNSDYGSASNSGTTMTVYSSYTPNFICAADGNGKGLVSSNIGLLSYDEVVHAGGYYNQSNTSYYLYNNTYWWTMSPAGTGAYLMGWYIYPSGEIFSLDIRNEFLKLRAVINLKTSTTVRGNGTSSSPWKVFIK